MTPHARHGTDAPGSPATPLVLLLLALATVFLFGGGRGHLYQEPTHDNIARNHMAVAMNLSPVHGFLGFYRLTRDADGDLGYEAYNRFPVLGHTLIKLATLPFPDDASARLAAARTLMLAFFAAAATLAYFALFRLAGSRWTALAATLLAFSGYYALYYNDMVATEGAIDLFGLMLALHGVAVFTSEGRFGQLLAKTCAALLLGWHVYALVLPFVLLGLAAALRGRDWEGTRRHATLGAVALTFGALVLAANFTREYVALGGEVAPTRLPSVQSMLDRTGLAALQTEAGGEQQAVEGSASASRTVDGKAWPAVAARELKRIAWSVPYAVGHFVGIGRPGSHLPKDAPTLGAPWVLLGFVLAALIVGATLALLFLRPAATALPLAALAASGPCWALGLPHQSDHPFEGMFNVGVFLAFFALLLPQLDRFARGRVRPSMLVGIAAALTFALSSFLMARATALGADDIAFERALTDDVDAIRELVSGRGAGSEGARNGSTILVSGATDACGGIHRRRDWSAPGRRNPRWRINWKYYFTGHVFVKYSDRGLADFVVSERIEGAPTLTPDNQLAFLYDGATHDAVLRRYERHAKQNAPVLKSPDYDLYFLRGHAGGELLYYRDHCPIQQVNDRFHAARIMVAGDSRVFVQVWPVDENDLAANRRPFGFENLVDFEQLLSGWRQDGKCYAVCRLPDYRIASVRAGTATGRRIRDGLVSNRMRYDTTWEGSFSPPASASR